MPMTPFIGVRISWLMLARKSDLSREASVAWSRASAMAASAPASAVMSASVPTQPVISPSSSSRAFEVSMQDPGGPARDLHLEPRGELRRLRRSSMAAASTSAALLVVVDASRATSCPTASAAGMPVISLQRGFV